MPMRDWLYTGQGPMRVGTQNVSPGEVVRAGFRPGKNFELIIDQEEHDRIQKIMAQAQGNRERGTKGESLSDFTILSTGLLYEADFSTMEYYASVGLVIIQYWSDQDDKKVPFDLPGLTVVRADVPKLPDTITRDDLIRFSYQVLGVFLGLAQCNTKYTIRVRSDEHVTDLTGLIATFLQDTRKIVASSIFWGNPLQMGDHIFVAETELLQAAYAYLCHQVAAGTPLKERQPSPEYALLTAFIEASRIKYPPEKEKEMVSDRADIVHISCFGDYAVVNHPEPSKPGGGTRRWTPINPCDYAMIATREQLLNAEFVPYSHTD